MFFFVCYYARVYALRFMVNYFWLHETPAFKAKIKQTVMIVVYFNIIMLRSDSEIYTIGILPETKFS